MIAKSAPSGCGMEPGVPEPFRQACLSGTAIDVYYGDAVTLDEVRATHPMAAVEGVR